MNKTVLIIISICIFIVYRIYKNKKYVYPESGIFSGWKQKSDFSAQDFETLSKEQAIHYIFDKDWSSEFQYQKESIDTNAEFCSAGIGIDYSKQQLLHICPHEDDEYEVHFMHGVVKKGLFRTSLSKICYTDFYVKKDKVINFIDMFYNKQFSDLHPLVEDLLGSIK